MAAVTLYYTILLLNISQSMEPEKDKQAPHPGGRPVLADQEKLVHKLQCHVRESEYQALRQDYTAWNSGRNMRFADFMREKLLAESIPQELKSTQEKKQLIETTQTLHHIRQQLNSINRNYNQITKRISSIEHTGKLHFEVQHSKTVIEKLAPLIAELDGLMKTQTEWLFD